MSLPLKLSASRLYLEQRHYPYPLRALTLAQWGLEPGTSLAGIRCLNRSAAALTCVSVLDRQTQHTWEPNEPSDYRLLFPEVMDVKRIKSQSRNPTKYRVSLLKSFSTFCVNAAYRNPWNHNSPVFRTTLRKTLAPVSFYRTTLMSPLLTVLYTLFTGCVR